VAPSLERVTLELDPDRVDFRGQAEISLGLDGPRSDLWVSSRALAYRGGSLVQNGRTIAVTVEPDDVRGAARVVLAQTAAAGPAVLRLEFSGTVGETPQALFRERSSSGWGIYTELEPIDARRVFPCFDEPAFKIPWELTLVVPERLVAVSNTEAVEETPAGAGMKRVRFRPTRPLPSYLLALGVGDFDVVTPPPLPASGVRRTPLRVRGIAPRGRGADLAWALRSGGELLGHLEAWFGTPFPYEKLDHLAIPDTGVAMENAGLITYPEASLLLGQDSTEDDRQSLAITMAHEMAHQWFGDLVTMRFWDDTWLNESFAEFLETTAVRDWAPEREPDLDAAEDTLRAMKNDKLESARAIRMGVETEADLTGWDIAALYPKGAAVLSMFETLLGPVAFRDGVRRYIAAHRDGNATTEDLLAELSRDRDIRGAFRTFIDQPGLPRVHARLECGGEGPRVKLRQERALPVGSRADRSLRWEVPVCVRAEGRSEASCTLLTDEQGTLALPGKRCPAWIHPNTRAAGYYLWTLPPPQMDALLTRGWPALRSAERLSAVNALLSAVTDGIVPAADGLARLGPMTRKVEPGATEQVLGLLHLVRERWVEGADLAAFEAMARARLRPLLSELGWATRPGETARLRVLRAKLIRTLAVDAADPEVLARAARLGRDWLGSDGALHPEALAPDLRDVAVVAAARTGDAALFEVMLERLRTVQDASVQHVLATGIGAFLDPALAARARQMELDGKLRFGIRIEIASSQIAALELRPDHWAWGVAHQRELLEVFSEFAQQYLPLWKHGCTDEAADALPGELALVLARNPGIGLNLRKAQETARLCAAVQAIQTPSVHAFLTRRPEGPQRTAR
jgi:alanyl aminopeptidase